MIVDKSKYTGNYYIDPEEHIIIIPENADGWHENGKIFRGYKNKYPRQFMFEYWLNYCTGNDDVKKCERPHLILKNCYGEILVEKEWTECEEGCNIFDFIRGLYPDVKIKFGRWDLVEWE